MAPLNPKISVLVITHNPRMDLLQWGLDSLEAQTLDKNQWEVVVVDNASPTPLDEAQLRGNRTFNLRLLREPRLGLSWGRYCGIKNTNAPLMVFLDDDNWFYPDYLEEALRLHHDNPHVGAFGGIAEGVFEKPIRPWMEHVLSLIGVVNRGDKVLFSDDKTREWRAEPIGAGMVFSRVVGMQYISFLDKNEKASQLDRKGNSLMSCGDTFLARLSYKIGLHCSYQPTLKIKHFMKAGRLNGKYFRELAGSIGKSIVLVEKMLGDQENERKEKSQHEVLANLLEDYQQHIRSKEGVVLCNFEAGRRMEAAEIRLPINCFLRRRKTRGYRFFLFQQRLKLKMHNIPSWLRHQFDRARRAPQKIWTVIAKEKGGRRT